MPPVPSYGELDGNRYADRGPADRCRTATDFPPDLTSHPYADRTPGAVGQVRRPTSQGLFLMATLRTTHLQHELAGEANITMLPDGTTVIPGLVTDSDD
jgi:hypothetical protein